MQTTQQQIIVQEAQSSGGNPFVLFIFFILVLVLHYLVPLIGTIYAQKSAKKWIAYWIILLAVNKLLQPILNFCFGVTAGSFLNLVLGVAVLFVCNDEKAGIIVETGDLGINIVAQQYSSLKEKGLSILRQYGLVA